MGNSAAVRISAAVMQAIHPDPDDVVEVRDESGRIVIEPTRQRTWNLDGIAKKNRHAAVDFGAAVAEGVW